MVDVSTGEVLYKSKVQLDSINKIEVHSKLLLGSFLRGIKQGRNLCFDIFVDDIEDFKRSIQLNIF